MADQTFPQNENPVRLGAEAAAAWLADKVTVPAPPNLLATAQAAFDKGARREAHELAAAVTQRDPRNIAAWLLRARTAAGLDETLNCLSRIIALDPQHRDAQQRLHQSLQRFLEDDASLAYVGESAATYFIATGTGLVLTVPKKRVPVEPYPPREPSLLRNAYRQLILALLGLTLAGLGAVIYAPLAMLSAFQANQKARTKADRLRSWLVAGSALLLLACAIPLSILFLAHL
ncbi:MAG TPA: hypothetical protein VLG46_07015 [Anaerolineae bacterium]|nr:hypothetical protein [Anaerolineae bacterium]